MHLLFKQAEMVTGPVVVPSLVDEDSSKSPFWHPIFIYPEPHNLKRKVHINSSQPCAMPEAAHLLTPGQWQRECKGLMQTGKGWVEKQVMG